MFSLDFCVYWAAICRTNLAVFYRSSVCCLLPWPSCVHGYALDIRCHYPPLDRSAPLRLHPSTPNFPPTTIHRTSSAITVYVRMILLLLNTPLIHTPFRDERSHEFSYPSTAHMIEMAGRVNVSYLFTPVGMEKVERRTSMESIGSAFTCFLGLLCIILFPLFCHVHVCIHDFPICTSRIEALSCKLHLGLSEYRLFFFPLFPPFFSMVLTLSCLFEEHVFFKVSLEVFPRLFLDSIYC